MKILFRFYSQQYPLGLPVNFTHYAPEWRKENIQRVHPEISFIHLVCALRVQLLN